MVPFWKCSRTWLWCTLSWRTRFTDSVLLPVGMCVTHPASLSVTFYIFANLIIQTWRLALICILGCLLNVNTCIVFECSLPFLSAHFSALCVLSASRLCLYSFWTRHSCCHLMPRAVWQLSWARLCYSILAPATGLLNIVYLWASYVWAICAAFCGHVVAASPQT